MKKEKVTDKQRNNSEGKERRLANLKPFKPGQSGNPKGRPKSVTLSEALRRELAKEDPENTEQSYAEKIAQMLVSQAAEGNVNAAKEIADRTEGKPRQAIDVQADLTDWRKLAKQAGLSVDDVIREAQRIIREESSAHTGH